jgi:hypothetical protein
LNDNRLPVMHQPVDQGRCQCVVRVEQGAPFQSYCQLLWMRFDSGGVLYLDSVDECGSRNYSLEVR